MRWKREKEKEREMDDLDLLEKKNVYWRHVSKDFVAIWQTKNIYREGMAGALDEACERGNLRENERADVNKNCKKGC